MNGYTSRNLGNVNYRYYFKINDGTDNYNLYSIIKTKIEITTISAILPSGNLNIIVLVSDQLGSTLRYSIFFFLLFQKKYFGEVKKLIIF
jgi:hypothetical protein